VPGSESKSSSYVTGRFNSNRNSEKFKKKKKNSMAVFAYVGSLEDRTKRIKVVLLRVCMQ